MAQGKKLFAFFCALNAVPLLTSAEKLAQRRRLPTKTVGQQRETDIRRFPLVLCRLICRHSVL